MPKPKRPESVSLPKSGREELAIYLEHANPAFISAPVWGTRWTSTHGETRSSSRHTFHIGIRYTNGRFFSCILVQTLQYGDMPIEGTIHDWGTEQPSLGKVLEFYQMLFHIQPLSVRPGIQPGHDDSGGDGGGNSSGKAWGKEVRSDSYGGYYYMGQDDEYYSCDSRGNDIQNTYRKTVCQMSNPCSAVLVFASQRDHLRHSNLTGVSSTKDIL